MESPAAGVTLAGRFGLVRQLGEGATGEVWLAEEGRRRVALKIARGATGAALLRAEFQQAHRLVHPGIVRVHELVDGPVTCLVMQFVQGAGIGTLRGAGFREIVHLLIPVTEALEYAHRQGVVHRDLKASNVLCDDRGQCLLTDFGLGAAADGGSLPGMSPQQLAGAAAAVSDDVYGFGALLYDLMAGEPLFHPDVTPDRINGEKPSIPGTDLAGNMLPEGLRRLMSAMLQKSPGERPPGIGAVRAALEEILRDNPADIAGSEPAMISPLERARQPAAGARDDAGAPSGHRRVGVPAAVVYGGLVFLAVIGLVVILYLPGLVRERGPLVRAVDEERAAPSAAGRPESPAGASTPVPQEVLDAALGELLKSNDELRKLNVDKWGGTDWAELRRLAQAGDAAYQGRDPAAAVVSYRAAVTLARTLLARAPAVLETSLREGQAALDAGEQARAITQFETALAVSPGDARASRGLDRARRLDQVLSLVAQASAAEAAGRRDEALGLYRRAAALDPAWAAATSGVTRLQQAAARDTYETQMARGFAAQAGRDHAAAQAAFEAALRVRPGDAQARSALEQVAADRTLSQLADLQAQARSLERDERWADALQRYEAALKIDANLADARQGEERSRSRLDLDQRLRRELGNADQFNDDVAYHKAKALLETARGIVDPGPVLQKQVAELDGLLQLALKPIPVILESDNLTEVTVFKVGRLGVFSNRTLELRPGAYVAVGSRPGYRDVRRAFRVAPGGAATVVVRCEEPI